MKIQKAFKYKLRPNKTSEAAMLRMVGSCRFVWNKLLALNLARLKRGQRMLHWVAMTNLLPTLKRFFPWLADDAYARSLQQVCKRLHDAFQRMFKKGTIHSGRKPRFKRKDEVCSARFPSALKVEGDRIKIPKIGWVRMRLSRDITGTVKNATLTRDSTGWFISMQTEQHVEDPSHPSTSEIGIDVGITKFATLSDGSFIEPLNAFKQMQDRLTKAQRILSRRKIFSRRWKKQKQIISRLHSKIANMRRDFLHKVSTTISNSHAVVYVEDLKVSNMSRSAKGSVENPGKNVRAKSSLNRSILDQGWSMFRTMLSYKLAWKGGTLVAVPPQYTSQKCPSCGHVAKENRKTQSSFECVKCEFSENADLVGAINILRAGWTLRGAKDLSYV